MSKYREIYLENMTKTVCEIMRKSDLTQQDIQFIALYRSELRKYEHTPLFEKIIKSVKDLKKFLSDFGEIENKEPLIETEDIDNGI